MEVARRQLIYVTRDPSEALCARFEERGWHIEIVASARDARKSLRSDLAIGGLLDLSSRYHARGYSSTEFVLRMTREEIGSQLGLKLETVSRLFSRFHDEGLIQVRGRIITLIDRMALQQLITAN